MLGVAAVLAGFTLAALLLAWSRWLARRRWAAAGHAALALAAGWAAVMLWSVHDSLASYEPVARGQPVAHLYVERASARGFRATLTRLPGGRVQVFLLDGDEWRLDARRLDWQGRAAEFGFAPRYRLERLSSRTSPPQAWPATGDDGADAQAGASSFALGPDTGDDLWAKARTSPGWARHLRGGHADSPWRPLADGALFEVWLEPAALRVEPANEAAADGPKPAR